ncbi:universal stress protein [Inquilinus limosus]|uniref:universal stress protein n=1 Tax=Inquilinus limosus TaxID=171674 RepID=UPI00047B994C|nr:universal stress protein [Inquilinus limosus]
MGKYLILCATDGSPAARKALDFAADLTREKGGKLLVMHVQQTHGSSLVTPGLEELERVENIRLTEADMLHGAAEHIAEQGARSARERGAPSVDILVEEGDPASRIVEAARDHGAEAIVIGSRGLGDLQGLLLGSVSHKVAHLAPCTCIIVR